MANLEGRPVLVTGVAGGIQGSTGAHLLAQLRARGRPVRALVRRDDERATRLRDAGATVLAFAVSLWGFTKVPRQYFPQSSRPELIVDMTLREGASITATEEEPHAFEAWLARDPDAVTYASYVGAGSPRFYLSLDQQLATPNFAQFVIMTKGPESREALRARLFELFRTGFPLVRTRVARLDSARPSATPCSSGSSDRTRPGFARPPSGCATWSVQAGLLPGAGAADGRQRLAGGPGPAAPLLSDCNHSPANARVGQSGGTVKGTNARPAKAPAAGQVGG